jgi:hypothetical protein
MPKILVSAGEDSRELLAIAAPISSVAHAIAALKLSVTLIGHHSDCVIPRAGSLSSARRSTRVEVVMVELAV